MKTELFFEAMRLLVVFGVFVVASYIIPFVREHITPVIETISKREEMQLLREWAYEYVWSIEQQHGDQPGTTKRDLVYNKIVRIRDQYDLSLTDDQINDLIEAAVKTLNQQG